MRKIKCARLTVQIVSATAESVNLHTFSVWDMVVYLPLKHSHTRVLCLIRRTQPAGVAPTPTHTHTPNPLFNLSPLQIPSNFLFSAVVPLHQSLQQPLIFVPILVSSLTLGVTRSTTRLLSEIAGSVGESDIQDVFLKTCCQS